MSDDEESSVKVYDGRVGKFEEWSKQVGRWSRSRHGRKLGDMFWDNKLPKLFGDDAIGGNEFNQHAHLVWESIHYRTPKQAESLWRVESGFWTRKWHNDFRNWEYDKLYDKVESKLKGDALLELEALGRETPEKIQAHLRKQFGGSGEDLKAIENYYEEGVPEEKGKPPFYKGINVESKLRQLASQRTKLRLLCPEDKREGYYFGLETTLVKITLKHLRKTDYHDTAKRVLNEMKMIHQMKALQPVRGEDGTLQIPEQQAEINMDDWDFRNFSDDWLPSWSKLRSALVAEYKERGFPVVQEKVPSPCLQC